MIQENDLVYDESGQLSWSLTIARLSERLGIPEATIRDAIESDNSISREYQLTSGRTLGLPSQEIPQPTDESAEDTTLTDPISDVVPAPHAIRTEEVLLLYMWVYQFLEDPEQYNEVAARERVHQYIYSQLSQLHTQLNDPYSLANGLFEAQEALLSSDSANAQRFANEDGLTFHEWLDTLSSEELFNLYSEIGGVLAQAGDDGAYIAEGQDVPIVYDTLFDYTDAFESSELNPADVYGEYQPDLALQDAFPDGFDDSMVLDTLVTMLLDAKDAAGITFFELGEYEDEEQLREALANQLPEDWTTDDLMALAAEYSDKYLDLTEINPIESGDTTAGNLPVLTTMQAGDLRSQSIQYLDARALDNLRAVAFDPNWNPAHDEQLLKQLITALDSTPPAVLGVNISWVTHAFRQFHDDYLAYHNWRLQLQNDLMLIEQEMVARQGEEKDPLWWVGAVVGTLIEFSDIAAPFLIIRDTLQGDWLGVGLGIADLAFGPVFDAIKSIRHVDEIVELSGDTARVLDDLVAIEYEVLDQARYIDEISEDALATSNISNKYGRILSWDELSDSVYLPANLHNREPINLGEVLGIGSDQMDFSLTEYIQRGDLSNFGLPPNPTLEEFEAFMLSEKWAVNINGVAYPVEISGIFVPHPRDPNRLVFAGAMLGETNLPGDLATAVEFHDVIDYRSALMTHLHPPGAVYAFSATDARKFADYIENYGLENIRAVSHDYIFQSTIHPESYNFIRAQRLTTTPSIPTENAFASATINTQQSIIGIDVTASNTVPDMSYPYFTGDLQNVNQPFQIGVPIYPYNTESQKYFRELMDHPYFGRYVTEWSDIPGSLRINLNATINITNIRR